MQATTTSYFAERAMARTKLTNFGISMEIEQFKELLTEMFHAHYRNIPSVDELLVRPREAIKYCDHVRNALFLANEEEAWDLPDDVILRNLLNIRKHG